MKIFNGKTELIDIEVNDESYRYRAIKGEHNITLYFSLPEFLEIPVGAYCEYQNEVFTLYCPANLKMQHSRNFEYTVVFEAAQAELKMAMFRNPVDGRLKFSITATPRELMEILVTNMNRVFSGWEIKACIDDTIPRTLSFNHTICSDALAQIAEEFGTEYEFDRRNVSLHKVEYNKDNPLSLSYGKGNGFKSGIGRTNYSSESPLGVLYIQGGSRNIDSSRNGGVAELRLPKGQSLRFDGLRFEEEEGFDAEKSVTYETDSEGLCIKREKESQLYSTEGSLDCSEIFPSRIGTISDVRFIYNNEIYEKPQDWSEDEWKEVSVHIIDKDIPDSLNYNSCLIQGESMTVVFQDGMLAGKEFGINYSHDAEGSKAGRRFEIISEDIDGMKMPGGTFIPKQGDKYIVFGCSVPDAYICDNVSKSGASWDMFRKGIRYLHEHEQQKFTFSGQLDGIWAKKDWLNIGGKIKLGGFVEFTDERFQPDPVLIRITGIKDYVNNPHSPEIELCNSVPGSSLSGILKKIDSNEVTMEEYHKDARQFTKRRFRDSEEAIAMLKDAFLNGYSDSISPLTVQTMMALVGDKSLQFRFVDSMDAPHQVMHDIHYDTSAKVLFCASGIIQHMTLQINGMSPSHEASEYRFWNLPEFESPTMDEPEKSYYLYAKVKKSGSSGTFYLSERGIPMEPAEPVGNVEDWQDSYFLLVGFLGSEQLGERSYTSWYGFTEILPGQITTDVLRDSSGKLVIDLANATITANDGAKIVGNLTIGAGSSGLENLSEWKTKQTQINNTIISTSTEYYLSLSDTELTGGSWSSEKPEWDSACYLWSRTKYRKNDGTESYSEPVNITKDLNDYNDGTYGNDNILTVAEKRSIRRKIEEIMQTSPEHAIPDCKVVKEIDEERIPAKPRIDIKTSDSAWKVVKVGDSNNGNPMDDYVGWVASLPISHSGTSVNKLEFNNNSEIAVDVTIEFQSDGESSFDYLMVGFLDQTATPVAGKTSSYDFDTKGRQKQIISKSYSIPVGRHSLTMVYRKDGSNSSGTDCAYYKITSIPKVQEPSPEIPETYRLKIYLGNLVGGSLYSILNSLSGREYNEYDYEVATKIIETSKRLAEESQGPAKLWENSNTQNAALSRQKYSDLFINYEKERSDLSDISYLQKTFGSSVNADGAILSSMIGVKNREGKVVAMINGSEIGKDDENNHGRLLLASGMDGIEDIKKADTKIFEDGTIVSDKFIAKEGCTFGDWNVREDGMWLYSETDMYGQYFSPAKQTLSNKGECNCSSSLISQSYGLSDGSGSVLYVNRKVIDSSRIDVDLADSNTGIFIDVDGSPSGFSSVVSEPYGNFAIQCKHGVFAGFRPHTRCISNIETHLSIYQHTIICSGTGLCKLWLPSKPEIGQTYIIFGGDGAREVHGDPYILHWAYVASSMAHTLGGGDTRTIVLVFMGNEWEFKALDQRI